VRIDLPKCSFKNCKYHLDCNCTSQKRYDACEFRQAQVEIETLNNIIKEDCGMLPDYEKYLGNKTRKDFAERLKEENTVECDVSMGYGRPCYVDAIPIITIDNLVKELEGK